MGTTTARQSRGTGTKKGKLTSYLLCDAENVTAKISKPLRRRMTTAARVFCSLTRHNATPKPPAGAKASLPEMPRGYRLERVCGCYRWTHDSGDRSFLFLRPEQASAEAWLNWKLHNARARHFARLEGNA